MNIAQKQPKVFWQLFKTWQQNRLVHAYLFEGDAGTGTIEMANWLAKTIFCQTPTKEGACLNCLNCRRIEQCEFPDVVTIQPEGASIKVDQIRQMKLGLDYTSMEQKQKVFIIQQVEKMSISAANSLLKFLEEPARSIYFILVTTNQLAVLPTILSRCQVLSFKALSVASMQQVLEERGVSKSLSELLAYLIQDVEEAVRLAEDEAFVSFMKSLWQWWLLIMRKDKESFVSIQTTLATHLTNREWANIGLKLLVLYVRDLTLLSNQQDDKLYFPNKKEAYKKSIGVPDIVVIHEAMTQLKANVSGQICYELMNLKWLGE